MEQRVVREKPRLKPVVTEPLGALQRLDEQGFGGSLVTPHEKQKCVRKLGDGEELELSGGVGGS
jgi:hypothetical protein